jgi:hypothetical protein
MVIFHSFCMFTRGYHHIPHTKLDILVLGCCPFLIHPHWIAKKLNFTKNHPGLEGKAAGFPSFCGVLHHAICTWPVQLDY